MMMDYFLFEESGDSEMFDPSRNMAVKDAEDAESCCSDSSFDHPAAARGWTSDGYGEADSSSSKVVNGNGDHHTGGTKKKLKNSVSESFIISSGVVNMDDITDDRLFWEACLAHGYP